MILAAGVLSSSSEAQEGEATPTVTVTAPATETPASRQHAFPLRRTGYPNSQPYVVQTGETLASIALQTGISAEAIAARNQMPTNVTFAGGETIYIPDPTPTPLPTATPTRTPTATATPTATPIPTGPSTLIRHGPRGSGQVALTFDMNGLPGRSTSIVQWLIRNRVPATLFIAGDHVDNTAYGREVVQLVDGNRNLLELGNHSYSHPYLTTLTDAQIRSQLLSTENAVARYSTLPVRPFMRPPYGDYNDRVLRVAGATGYPLTVMWDVDPQDWSGASAAAISSNVLGNAQGGSIVLLHLHGANTEAALPAIVSGLRQRGYELVKLSDLLN